MVESVLDRRDDKIKAYNNAPKVDNSWGVIVNETENSIQDELTRLDLKGLESHRSVLWGTNREYERWDTCQKCLTPCDDQVMYQQYV